MSKRNIAYIKPQDPAFLARLKNQIGYKEGPTVETKRQKFENDLDSDEDSGDRDGEEPIVVVLKEGDLTAEEAAREEERIAREAAEAPADLNQRIIFKKRNKDSTVKAETLNSISTASSTSSLNLAKKKNSKNSKQHNLTKPNEKSTETSKSQKTNNKLSFDNEDEVEEYY